MENKAFGLWSVVFLGIGSMVGAGIFIVIGEAGAIAGNLVWVSFIFGAISALLSGYSLAKLAVSYPSRGGIVEYLVQGFGEGIFSGSTGVLFYISQLIAISAVAKSFGAYADTFISGDYANIFALGIVFSFILINLIGASLVAKSETIIVFIKLTVLTIFSILALIYAKGDLSDLLIPTQSHSIKDIFFAVGLTFFAYQGFSVMTNTVEDMKNPKDTILKAMVIAILIVATLYLMTSWAVLGNLSIAEVVKAKDYALAQAAEPIFGHIGFEIMAVTALFATASAINATLYATTEIGYTLAKNGNLPKIYTYSIHNSFEGLIVSGVLIVPMILFLNLSEITTIAALVVLIIQGITHIGHLFQIKKTGANIYMVLGAIISMFVIAGIMLYHSSKDMPYLGFYVMGAFLCAFFVEVVLRLTTKRVIQKQTHQMR